MSQTKQLSLQYLKVFSKSLAECSATVTCFAQLSLKVCKTAAYAACVGAKMDDIQKGECEKQWQAVKECLQRSVSLHILQIMLTANKWRQRR
jgi:hypothetical protein